MAACSTRRREPPGTAKRHAIQCVVVLVRQAEAAQENLRSRHTFACQVRILNRPLVAEENLPNLPALRSHRRKRVEVVLRFP